MTITQTRVKQYNSTYKTVISVDGVPVAMTKADKRASDIVAYLNGYDVELNDGAIRKILDQYRQPKQNSATFFIGIGMPKGTYHIEVSGYEAAWDTFQKTKDAIGLLTEVKLMDSRFKILASSKDEE